MDPNIPIKVGKQSLVLKLKRASRVSQIKRFLYVVPLFFVCAILAFSWLFLFWPSAADANQFSPRSLSMVSGVPGATSNWTFTFTPFTNGETATAIQSFKFVACTTALGTYGVGSTTSYPNCTAPTGLSINQNGPSTSLGGSWTNTTAFTRTTSTTGNCNPGAAVLCITRTQAATESGAAKTIVWPNLTSPTTANSSFYVGMYMYSDVGYATNVDYGTVAAAVVQSLLITASVTEILQFCIGASTVNDLTTAVTSSCGTAPGASSTVGLGIQDPTAIRISPVAVSPNSGNNSNGIAILRTNALNGTNVSYDAIAAGSGTNHLGALRVTGATCNAGSVNTDPCFNSQGASQAAFTAGTENFGFTIAGVSCVTEQTFAGAYSCAYASGTEHLAPQSQYIGQAATFGTSNGFAYSETTGSSTLIAAASAGNVVTDEALILKFASAAAIATPSGSYSVNIDYTAVSSY